MTRKLAVLALVLIATGCSRTPSSPSSLAPEPTPIASGLPTQIVNLDSNVNGSLAPVQVLLEPGTYDVTPVGTEDGGLYEAFNAWGPTTCESELGCDWSLPRKTGWLHSYRVLSPQLADVVIDGRPIPPIPVVPADGRQSYFLRLGSAASFQVFAPRIHMNPGAALAHALRSSFVITSRGLVGFAIPDETLSDNVGGVSLRVEIRP